MTGASYPSQNPRVGWQRSGPEHRVRTPRRSRATLHGLPTLRSKPQVAEALNDAVSFVNQRFYDPLEAMRIFALLHVMNPIRDVMQMLPWQLIVAPVALAGWGLGGAPVSLTVAAIALFIVVTGYWSAATGVPYLTLLAVFVSLAIGFALGIWAASHPRIRQGIQLFLDTLQTLPTLVYLLPAVMLFRNGDFSALWAIVSFALAPAVRYGIDGLLHVPSGRVKVGVLDRQEAPETLAARV